MKRQKKKPMEPKLRPDIRRQLTRQELRSQSPLERQQYLRNMVTTIERNYPELDKGAKQSFAFFLTEITPIIRPSGNEEAMRNRLITWTTHHEYHERMTHTVDNAGNLFVQIGATPGYEDMPGIILHSHMDMNCNPSTDEHADISPENNPVVPIFKNNDTKIAADGTTLGADDGMGVATEVILADELLTGSLPHGKVGLLFTTGEEAGLVGAQGFSFPKEVLTGYSYLLNLDNEDSHEAIVGAAGGRDLDISFSPQREISTLGLSYARINLDGLHGGHSGAEIHLGRLNAIKALGRILEETSVLGDVRLVSLTGGSTDSSIPQTAHAVVALQPGQQEALEDLLEKVRQTIEEESVKTKESLENNPLVKEKEKKKGKLKSETPILSVTTEKPTLFPMTAEATREVLMLLADIPSGLLEIDEGYSIVKTSTNLGTVTTGKDGTIRIRNFARSSSPESLDSVIQQLQDIALRHRAQVNPGDKGFTPWEPDFAAEIVTLAQQTHQEVTGKNLEVIVVHAGIESHTIYEKMSEILGNETPENFQIISLGPSMDNVHTTNEEFDIAEAAEFFPALRLLLKTILQNEAVKRGKPFPLEEQPSRHSLAI